MNHDDGTPYTFDMRDFGTAFGLGVMVALALFLC